MRHRLPPPERGRVGVGVKVMTLIVELDRATLKLGGRAVLADVSFAIGQGEFIGVLGPNGAGKTTLMRAILGLLPPSAGALRVFGKEPQRGDPAIGYLPQIRTVLPDLRVRGLDCDVFVGESTVRYLEPVWTDFVSEARLGGEASWDSFFDTLAARGRARIDVACRVPGTGEKPAATLEARFVAKRRSPDAV